MKERLPLQTYQTELIAQLMAPQPTVIGGEGGPCGGKTTLVNEVEERAAAQQRTVVALSEVASEHIEQLHARGQTIPELATNNRPAYLSFQKEVLKSIIANIESARQTYAGTDAIILADRPDIGAYVTPEEYRQLQAAVGIDRPPIHDMVDKLLFLPSVASEQPERYAELRQGNTARYETTATEAAAVCAANLAAVRTHPELHVAWGGVFEAKIRHLAATILQPEMEKEIKLGVRHDEAETFILRARFGNRLLNIIDIRQTYHEFNGQEFRLRSSVGSDGRDHYFFTVKEGEGAFRTELQRRISLGEYGLLLAAPRLGRELRKRRHVVLDTPEENGRRRLWFADEYQGMDIPEWHFETDVQDQADFDTIADRFARTRRVITESAKALIFN